MHEKPAPPSSILALRQQFLARTCRDAGELEAALERFNLEADSGAAGLLRDKAHALVGGLSVFGFAQASSDAELFAALLVQAPRDPGGIARQGQTLCASLRTLSFEIPNVIAEEPGRDRGGAEA